MSAPAGVATNDLSAYVPRLVLEWASEHADERHRRVDGSLAFCDLSGFTAMSEKLAKLGRRGAEELSDVLNTIFGALLADAAAFGGSMLKYGGDAVLVFFWGDGHEARSVAATHRMRATLRRLGTVRTAGGTVRVRMSVGVHSGSFDAFLVGESHRELLVCGTGATITCAMETAADAGEVLLSPATAAALPASCVGAPKGDGFLLRRAPRAEERAPDGWGTSPAVDAAPFVPLGLRSYLSAGAADAEHRHVAVAFVAFGGVDALLAECGAAAAATVLHDFVAACQRAFERYGVCFLTADVYGDGGKVIGTTGAPLAYEDNEERLLRAAREIADGEHGLDVHIGLNRGYVFSGDVGPVFRRTYTILGDAVNTAARVMASCTEHNQVRAMPEVVDRALSRFETVEQPPFAAKGKALPLVTVAVGEPTGPRLDAAQPDLVGRSEELAQMHEAWATALGGRGGVLALVGEAGVGKSRLLDELAAHARASGAATLTTFAERYERDTAFFVLRQLHAAVLGLTDRPSAADIAGALAAVAPELTAWTPLMARVFGLGIEPTPEVAALDEANVADRLAQLTVDIIDATVEGPALWIVDNVDLADAASAAVLAAVAPLLPARPWLLALAQRSDTAILGTPHSRVLAVAPLSEEDSIRLARNLDPRLLPHDAAQLALRSGGNPMFLRQLVAAGAAGEAMADSVETAVAARIDALAAKDRAVLRTAAVLGGRFSVGSLRELVDDGRAPDLGVLRDFIAVTDGGDYVFRQAIYREVAYAGLTYKRRRALHHAAGRSLEAARGDEGPGLGRLSLHFHEAHDWQRSWRYSREAGSRAYVNATKPVAVTFFQRALEAGTRAGASKIELARVANDLGKSLFFSGRLIEAERSYRRAAAMAPKGSALAARVAQQMVATLLETGRIPLAKRWIARGLADLDETSEEPGVSEVRVGLLGGLVGVALHEGRIEAALEAASAALNGAGPDPGDRGQAEQLLAHVHHWAGHPTTAAEHAAKAVEFLRQTDFRGTVGQALNTLGGALQLGGDWTGAERIYREAGEAYSAAGNAALEAVTVANVGEILVDQGRWDDAAPLLREAVTTLLAVGSEDAGFVAALQGRMAARRRDLANDEWRRVDDPARYTLAVPIEAALASRDGAAALAALDAAVDAPLLQRPALLRGLALRLLDRADDATVALETALADAESDDPFGKALALIALGRRAEAEGLIAELGVIALPAWLTEP